MKGISRALKSADHVKAVAAELQRNNTTNLFYCLWVFMYESGLRISDVLKLKYEDVEGQSHLKVKQEKTGNVVRPKVTASMLSVVAQRKAEQAKMPVATDYIFSAATLRSRGNPVTRNTVFAEFGKMGRRAGFSNVGCHTPRKVGAEFYSRMGCRLNRSPISRDEQIHGQRCITSGMVRMCRTI